MQKSGSVKRILLLLLFAVVGLIALLQWRPSKQPAAPAPNGGDAAPVQPSRRTDSAPRRQAAAAAQTPEESQTELGPLKLPQEKLDAYLKLHRRDAASLLAVFHASEDVNYLKEAATNFPNDPHVQLAVLSHDVFPDQRRQWLDAFKASSPSNSLANYLSAREYFKNNETDAAIKELAEATGKSQFTDYAMDSYLGEEELFRSSGASPLIANVAGMAAMAADLMPQLAGFKGIANGVSDLQKQYVTAGDAASSENLAQMAFVLANRLSSGDGGRFLISQLVGIAAENVALQQLNQNTPYDFLGGQTPVQRIDDLKQRKQAFKELTQGFQTNFFAASEAEQIAYTERVKIYGEVPAMQWWQQQRRAATPNTGN